MNVPALPLSLWRETATPALDCAALDGDIHADIAIIGGGYTGLSAAIRAIELGLKPVVLESSEIGFGASGRNGGVVSTKFRVSLSNIAKSHGVAIAQHMNALGHEAMDCVETYIDRFEISAANFIKSGNLRCAHNNAAFYSLIEEAKTVREVFGDTSLTILDAQAVANETGSTTFHGGVLNKHAGIIHPLNFARGLARGVLASGAEIYENSPVIGVATSGSGRRITTAHGSVLAERVLIATNGYSDLTNACEPVRKTVIPFRSAIIATEALPQSLFEQILPENRSYSETRRMMRWFRRVGNRILFGGRGAFGKNDSATAYAMLEEAMHYAFPQLAAHKITHRWSGQVAMTMDSLPQIGLLDRGLAFSLGYNGAGIAMSTLLGRYSIDLLQGIRPDLAIMFRDKPQQIPFFSLRAPAVRTVAAWYQMLDKFGR